MSNDDELCQIFCDYFSNIMSDLQILSISKNISTVTNITDPVLAVIIQLLRRKEQTILNQFFLLRTLTK